MDNNPQPVEQVPVGTRLKVLPGTRVPLDGTVVAGSSTVDESSLTGESQPVAKTVDDSVSAGTLNQGGYLEIISTKLSKDSCVGRFSLVGGPSFRALSRRRRAGQICCLKVVLWSECENRVAIPSSDLTSLPPPFLTPVRGRFCLLCWGSLTV